MYDDRTKTENEGYGHMAASGGPAARWKPIDGTDGMYSKVSELFTTDPAAMIKGMQQGSDIAARAALRHAAGWFAECESTTPRGRRPL